MTRIFVIRAFIRCLINLVSHCLSGASTLHSAPTVPAHPYNLDQLITEDGTVTIEQPILSLEEATSHHFLLSSSASATTLLPGQVFLRISTSPTFKICLSCLPPFTKKLRRLMFFLLHPVGSRWCRHSIGTPDSGRSWTSAKGRGLPSAKCGSSKTRCD